MISGFVDHLWQSTLFVGAAWFLTLALRKNPARVRYSVWFIASAKFLIPFSLLVGIGAFVPRPAGAPRAETGWVAVAEQVRPLVTIPAVGAEVTLNATGANRPYFALAAFSLWFCGFAAIGICWAARWKRIRELRSRATPVRIRKCIEAAVPVMSVPELVEPGVFGILRPILLLPEGIEARLNEAQLEAILAHELCHVRRRDNLTAAIHMAVQAAFWFHPLVWWLGARLVDERERACDEEVLRLGNRPQVYAAGILNVCKFYVSSPLACASGVTGSDLKRRIEAIVTNRAARNLDTYRRILLIVAGAVALIGPVAVGIFGALPGRGQTQPESTAPAFEAASVKPHQDTGMRNRTYTIKPGGITYLDTTLGWLIATAYGVKPYQISGPDWIVDTRSPVTYDVVATAGKAVSVQEVKRMVGPLLAERFHLVFHRETRELPVFALLVAKGGPKFKGPGDGGDPNIRPDGEGGLSFQNFSMDDLAGWLTMLPSLGRPVVDHTSLAGSFSFHANLLGIAKGAPPGELKRTMLNDEDAAGALRAALPGQLGLKLEAQKAPIEILVIDHADRAPTAN